MGKVIKTLIKIITIKDKYKFRVYLVEAGQHYWLEASPVWKGIKRTAETEQILKIILENDIMNLERQEQANQRVR